MGDVFGLYLVVEFDGVCVGEYIYFVGKGLLWFVQLIGYLGMEILVVWLYCFDQCQVFVGVCDFVGVVGFEEVFVFFFYGNGGCGEVLWEMFDCCFGVEEVVVVVGEEEMVFLVIVEDLEVQLGCMVLGGFYVFGYGGIKGFWGCLGMWIVDVLGGGVYWVVILVDQVLEFLWCEIEDLWCCVVVGFDG